MELDLEGISSHISNWLKEYCIKNRIQGMVVGISGGIDSALTSTLVAKTGLPTIVVEIPIHQKKIQRKRAINHMDWLTSKYSNVETHNISLTKVFDTFYKTLIKETGKGNKTDLSLANLRARLRMACLYFYASERNSIVVGTGNKVEDFGVGFFTKYGDGGVDVNPIADLLKSEVYMLAKYLEINQEILKAAPTDGLWGDDITDEDQLGASYAELEWAMNNNNNNNNNDKLTPRELEVLAIYEKLHRDNLHKMKPIPICKLDRFVKYINKKSI